jgi:prevent-host-death family protein
VIVLDATILDLRRKMADVLRALERNESVRISYRGRPRAILIPVEQSQKSRVPVSSISGFGMWKDYKSVDDVAGYVRNLRKPRINAV